MEIDQVVTTMQYMDTFVLVVFLVEVVLKLMAEVARRDHVSVWLEVHPFKQTSK